MNRKLFTTIAIALILAVIPVSSWAVTMPKDVLNYTVSVETSGQGQLYFNYGKNMEFLLVNGSDAYNTNCLVRNQETYKFSTVVNRGIIPCPEEDWYFDGFYDKFGNKLALTTTNIDLIRVTVDGLYYYDYYPSYDNSTYKNYTKQKYKKEVKNYTKTLYGTTRYKVLDQVKMYNLPKKTQDLYPRFKSKTLRGLTYPTDIVKNYGDGDFLLWPSCAAGSGAVYRSSSSKVLTLEPSTGLAKIKGEGIAAISVTFSETERYLRETVNFKVRIKPIAVSLLTAKRTSAKTVNVKWTPDSKCSGYEIQVGTSSSFSKISGKKTVASAKKSSTNVTVSKNSSCKAVRIRPYKSSRGEKLYGPYTVLTLS